MSLGSRLTFLSSGILIYQAIWPQQIWAEKWGAELCPFAGGAPGSSSNTMWPALRPTCVPSFILIRSTVWPQYTNVRDRTGETGQTTVGWHMTNRFTNGRPKTDGEPAGAVIITNLL